MEPSLGMTTRLDVKLKTALLNDITTTCRIEQRADLPNTHKPCTELYYDWILGLLSLHGLECSNFEMWNYETI